MTVILNTITHMMEVMMPLILIHSKGVVTQGIKGVSTLVKTMIKTILRLIEVAQKTLHNKIKNNQKR